MSDAKRQHTETELRQELHVRERVLIDAVRLWRHTSAKTSVDSHLRRSVDAYEAAKRAYDEACERSLGACRGAK